MNVRTCAAAILAVLLLGPAAPCAPNDDDAVQRAMQVLEEAKRGKRSPADQAAAVARLAWPETGTPDPVVAALARQELVEFGKHGMGTLRATVRRVRPEYGADVAAAIVESGRMITAGVPPDYVPALVETLWYGTADARRVALAELERHFTTLSLLPAIDTAYEYPALTGAAIAMLAAGRDDRARHFLGDVLETDQAGQRTAAARALARIGGRATDTLRNACTSADPAVRRTAIEALLPDSAIDDLTTLYEYVALNPDEDPQLLDRVRLRAMQLESLFESQRRRDAAPDDF